MTTAQRLWVGFGTLTGVLAISIGTLIVLLAGIQRQQEERTFARVRMVATLDLELGVMNFVGGVTEYLQTADSEALAVAETGATAADAAVAEYLRVAFTDRQQALATRVAALWTQLRSTGRTLLDGVGGQQVERESASFSDLSSEFERLLDGDARSDAVESLDVTSRAGVTRSRITFVVAVTLLLLGLAVGVGTARSVAKTVERTEAETVARRDQLQSMFDVMQDGVAVFDMDGNLVEANHALAVMHGYDGADDMKQNLARFATTFELFDRDGAVVSPERWPAARVLAGEPFQNLDLRIRRRDIGLERFFSYSGTPVRDSQGSQYRGIVAIRDVTESERARVALDEQRSLLTAVLDAAPTLIFVKDRAGRFRVANRAIAAVYGTTPEELVGRSDADFNPSAAEVDEFNRDDRDVIDSGVARRIPEEPVTNAGTGETRWYQTVKVPLALPGVSERMVLGISSDITERKRSDEAKAASDERARLLMESIPDPVIAVDDRGTVVFASAQVERVFGYAPAELIGQSVEVLVPDGLREGHQGLRRGYAAAPRVRKMGTARGELAGRRRDGTEVPIEITLGPVSTPEGLLVMCVVSDLTGEKELEAQLRQAQKMEAVGQLTGGIAHDFNNILTVIIGNAEMIAAMEGQDVGLRADLDELLVAARRGATMIGRLLQFSRRGSLSMEPVRPGAVVSDLRPMLRRLIPETIDVSITDATGDADTVLGDVGSMEQMLVNLCTNARDAMPDGGTLTLECERAWLDEGYHATHPWVRPGAYVSISVTDTGTGMDDLTKERLFEPFFTTKPSSQGTGLGMAMVYGIMKQHGGMVHVYSEVGQGSTMKLYFPLTEGDEVEDAANHDDLDREGARFGTETILVAEDEPSIRRTTKRALEGKGYTVMVAEDGEAALELYNEHRSEIALVISDLVMPRLGGRQLVEALRAQGSMVPVLFTSGYSPETATGTGKFPEGVVFLQKPWTLDDLYTRVRVLLDGDGDGDRLG